MTEYICPKAKECDNKYCEHKEIHEKKLIAPKMVRREAWTYTYWSGNRKYLYSAQGPYSTQKDAEDAGLWSAEKSFFKTILLHSWEEPEGEKT